MTNLEFLKYLEKEMSHDSSIIEELSNKNKSSKLLLSQKLISPIEANQTKIDLLKGEIEQQKNAATKAAIIKGIQTLTEVQ